MGGVEKGLVVRDCNDDAICPATAKSRSSLHPREPIARDEARMQLSRSSRATLLSSSIRTSLRLSTMKILLYIVLLRLKKKVFFFKILLCNPLSCIRVCLLLTSLHYLFFNFKYCSTRITRNYEILTLFLGLIVQ